MDPKEKATILDALALLSAGSVTVSVDGRPFISIRPEDRTLDMEVNGAREAGVGLAKVVRMQEGDENVLIASERIAGRLAHLGWKLTLRDGESRLLTMGTGVSRLTGRISVSPLKLKRLLEALD